MIARRLHFVLVCSYNDEHTAEVGKLEHVDLTLMSQEGYGFPLGLENISGLETRACAVPRTPNYHVQTAHHSQ